MGSTDYRCLTIIDTHRNSLVVPGKDNRPVGQDGPDRGSTELSERALESLRGHRNQQADREYMFPSTTGTPTNSSNLMYRCFEPILKRAGLPQRRFHDLRHTCATIRFMKGQHPERVQGLLGHASIAMTMDIYSHVIPGMGDDNSIMDDL